MMFTVRMKFLTAAILSRDARLVSDELLRQGTLDALSITDIPAAGQDALSKNLKDGNLERIREIRKRAEGFLALADPPVRRSSPESELGSVLPDLGVVEKKLDVIASRIQDIRDRQKDIQEQMLRLDELSRHIEAGGPPTVRLHPEVNSFLEFQYGSVPGNSLPVLEKAFNSLPAILASSGSAGDGRILILVVMLKRDMTRIMAILNRNGWIEAEQKQYRADTTGTSLKELDTKKALLKKTLNDCAEEYRKLYKEKGDDLATTWARLRAHELSLRLQSSFAHTQSVSILSGWIPEKDSAAVDAGIRRVCAGRCHIEWKDDNQALNEDLNPPVSMKNPGILAPFQTMVSNFGIPHYGSVNPAPFVAVAYLCMFGLMFGDAGHGLVLVLVGSVALFRARKSGKPENLAWLILYCGGAAIGAGLLFGSVFGQPLFPPLWFNYHGVVLGQGGAEASVRTGPVQTVYDILGITIRFGMIVLSTGFVINWINLFRRKQWITLIFDKAGLAGGWIYGAGAWTAFYYVAHRYRELPSMNLLIPLLVLPTMLLGVKSPLEYRLGRHDRQGEHEKSLPGLVMEFFMDWLVEILEVYSGYLANTLSFMRVAGLGIAHVSLMSAFSQIAAMLGSQGNLTIAGLSVLIVGNILVISLEGLSAGIQALRLNYYEFFSKFFNSTGKAYNPVSFRNRD